MISLCLAEVAAATGGRLDLADGNVVVDHVTTDSRLVRPGSLFVALRGEHADGHDFAAVALAAGAVAVLAAQPVGGPAVVVPAVDGTGGPVPGDPVLPALGLLAHEVRGRASATVVGITGSSGKTGTKDLVASVLARSGPTVAAEGSFNNDLGVPLTILAVTSSTRHLVLEMGARGAGHIARLCRVAEPEVGVVLNIGSAHLGEFGSVQATADAKAELVEALPPTGFAVLNLDDPLVATMARRTFASVLGVSAADAPGASLSAQDIDLDDGGHASFLLRAPDGSARVGLRLVGAHYVSNALAAAAVGHAAGLGVEEIASGLASAMPGRSGRMQLTVRPDGVSVINDAYNANPDSARAALQALVALGRSAAGRTWAVLGEMLELGQASARAHEDIGRYAAELGVTRVIAVGAGARSIHIGASRRSPASEGSLAVKDVAEALSLLRREVRPGDVVLVKASRASGLRQLGDALAADASEPQSGIAS